MAIDGNSPRKQKRSENQEGQSIEGDNDIAEQADDVADDDEDGERWVESDLLSIKSQASKKQNGKQSLGQNAELYLQQFMNDCGKPCSNVSCVLEDHGKMIQCKENTTVLRKGSTNTDLFVIAEGEVAIYTDNRQVFRVMMPGEVFGDLSAIFGLHVTTTVKVYSKSTVLMAINQSGVKSLFPAIPKDLTDWCIQRHFLPTSDELDTGRVYRRMTLEALKNIPLFHDWPENAIKQLIVSMEGGLVSLYPDQSTIVMEGDPLASIHVVVYGRLEIYAESGYQDFRKTIDVTSHSDPFVFTEAAVMQNNLVSRVSIKALSSCHVIQIKLCDIKNIMESYPDPEAVSSENCRLLYLAFQQMCIPLTGNQHLLYLEILASDLKQSAMYEGSSTLAIMNKIIGGDIVRVKEGGVILKPGDRLRVEAVYVIDGRVMQDSVTFQESSMLFDTETDKDNEERGTYTSGGVIDVEHDVKSDNIIADIESLVLKINRIESLGDNYSENAASSLQYV